MKTTRTCLLGALLVSPFVSGCASDGVRVSRSVSGTESPPVISSPLFRPSSGSDNSAAAAQFVVESTTITPIQVAVGGPLLQLFPVDWEVRGLRLSLWMGSSASVNGLDIGIMNFCGRFSGIQIGLGNGLGFFWGPGPDYKKMSLWEATPDERLNSHGLQVGFMNGVAAHYSGIQLGVANEAEDMTGVQLGILNSAERACGIQIGTAANVANELHGLQMSLFYNYARELHGVQIGLLNRADNGVLFHPFPGETWGIPIINAVF